MKITKNKLKKAALPFVSLIIVVLLWAVIAFWVNISRGHLFPTPVDTFLRFRKLFTGELLYNHTIWEHILNSLFRWSIGYLLAAACGVILGLLFGSFKLVYEIFMPIVHILQLIPGLAWIPIALLIFGIGNTATIFMVFIIGITPVIINTAGGIRTIPPIYCKAAQMMGAKKNIIFFKVLIPASILSIINGLRIGLANAWRVLIAAEMIVGTGLGLGHIIIQSRWSLRFEAAFVSIIIISMLGLVIEKGVFGIVEKTVMKNTGLMQET